MCLGYPVHRHVVVDGHGGGFIAHQKENPLNNRCDGHLTGFNMLGLYPDMS